MSDIVIKAKGLGKKYLIGQQSERERRYTALWDVAAHDVKSVLNETHQVLNGQQLLDLQFGVHTYKPNRKTGKQ